MFYYLQLQHTFIHYNTEIKIQKYLIVCNYKFHKEYFFGVFFSPLIRRFINFEEQVLRWHIPDTKKILCLCVIHFLNVFIYSHLYIYLFIYLFIKLHCGRQFNFYCNFLSLLLIALLFISI